MNNCTKSRFRGVGYDKNCPLRPWTTTICHGGTQKIVGWYADEISAALAYNEHAIRLGKKLNQLGPPLPSAQVTISALGAVVVPVGSRFALVDYDDLAEVSKYRWSLTTHGYAARLKRNKGSRACIFMHQQVFKTTCPHIDHINQNKLDNRKCNLRGANKQQNGANRGKSRRRRFSSVFKGVSRTKGDSKWEAYICVDFKKINLGRFDSESEAALAYNEAAKKHFGEFAYLNEITPPITNAARLQQTVTAYEVP